MADFLQGDPASFPKHDTVDLDAFRAALVRAEKIGQPIPPLPEEPKIGEMLGAAFRQSNSLGSILNSQSVRELLSGTKDETPIAPSTILQELKVKGLAHHAALFEDVSTKAQFDARVADLQQELKDRETLQASGGMLSEFALGIVDPTNFVPIARGIQTARAAANVGKVLSKGTIVGSVAAEAAGSAVAQEFAFQGSQVNRSAWDSAANVGASTIFGVALGFGSHGLSRMLGPKLANKVETRVDAAMDDLRAGGPKMTQRIDDALKVHEQLLPAEQAAKAAGEPDAPAGTIRMYHGGNNFEKDQNLWFTTDRKYAEGYASKNPDTSRVHYIDVPEDHPMFVSEYPEQHVSKGFTVAKDLGPELTNGRKVVDTPVVREFARSDQPDPRLEAKSAGAAANPRQFPEYDLMNAKLAGLNMATLVQKVGKVFETEVGGVRIFGAAGAAIAQGLRHPRLELMADKISLSARKLVLSLAANPNPIAKEGPEGGHTIAVGKHFDEELAPYIGAKAEATKQVHDIWATNKKGFSDIDEFGERVYFASINGGVDKFGGHPAIEQAAKIMNGLYQKFEKGLQETGWLKEGVQLRGAETYVPWVHKVQQIMRDKEPFIDMHASRMADNFEQDYIDALHVKSIRAQAMADEMKVVDAVAAVRTSEVKRKYDGDGGGITGTRDRWGLIREAKQDLDELKKRIDIERKEKLAEIDQKYKDNLAAGQKSQANAKAREAERDKFRSKFDVDAHKQLDEASRKIEQRISDKKDAIDEIDADRRMKQRELEHTHKSPEAEQQMLKLNTEKKRIKQAEKIANQYYEHIVKGGNELDLLDGPDKIAFPAILKARKAIITQEEAAARNWTETNIFHVTDGYTRRVGPWIASSRTFKKPVEVELPDGTKATEYHSDPRASHLMKQISDDYDTAISSSGGGDREAALRQAKAEQLRNAQLLHDGRMGKTQQFAEPNLQRAADYAKQFNSWRLMGGSVLSSLGDPMNIAMAHGFQNTISNGFVPMLQNFKAAMGSVPAGLEPDIFRINRISGAVLEREANSVLGAMMDLHSPNTGRTKGQVFAENMTKTFWKYSGLEFWTQFWKNVTAGVTHARLIEASQRGWDSLSASEKTWLANGRIDQDMLGRIKQMHDAQPEKFSAGIQYGAIDGWADREAANRFGHVLQRESNFGIVTPDAGNKLAFQFTPMGSLFGQFRSFGLTNASTVIARNTAIANVAGEKTGNMYGGLLGLATMGAVVDAVKFVAGDSTLYGNSKKDPNKSSLDLYAEKWRKTPGEALYNALDRSSVFMPLTEVSNIAQKIGLPNIQGGFSLALRDDKTRKSGSSRFANRTFAEAALGPTVGLVEDVVGAGRLISGGISSATGIGEAFKPTSAQFAGARRLIPFQNVPGFQQGINTVHQRMGTAYDWPKE